MSNINVNRNNAEPDNLPNSIDTPKRRFRLPGEIVPLTFVLIVGLGSLWIGSMITSAIWCNIVMYGIETCTAFTVATFGVPALVGALIVIGIIAALIITIQNGINASWIENLGMRIHRQDLRTGYNRSFDVIMRRAESESTRGLDTYSPSIHTTTSSAGKEPLAALTDKNPLANARISVEEIFNFKDE